MDDLRPPTQPAWFDALRADVDRAFVVTGADTPGWPDPHADRGVLDEEYSRVTDGSKYRILGARVDAWVAVLADRGLARTADAPVEPWIDAALDLEAVAGVRRITPAQRGGLSVLFASTLVDGAPFGLEVGIARDEGQPVHVGLVPDCGCDACDSGSADLLEVLDDWVLTVARGGVAHATLGDQRVTRTLHGWTASGRADPAWLAETSAAPVGVDRWIGGPWSGLS